MMLCTALLGLVVSSSVWLSGPLPADPTRIAASEGQIWVGTQRGLYRLRDPEPAGALLRPRAAALGPGPAALEAVWIGPAILDLAPGRAGELWIASSQGLARWSEARGVVPEPALGAGGAPRGVAWAAGRVYVATDAGLFVGDAGSFARDTSLPAGAVDAVRAAQDQVWVARRGALFSRGPDGRFTARLRAQPPGWWELLAVLPDATLVVPQGIWRVGSGLPERWSGVRPPLRGGAGLQGARAVVSDSELTLIEGQPLAPDLRPLARAELAGAAVVDVAAEGAGALLVLAETGVLRVLVSPGAASTPSPGPVPSDPSRSLANVSPADFEKFSISALQQAVLVYLELEPGRMLGLEGRARRSLWLPQVRFSSGLAADRSRGSQRSQTFNSGSVRNLTDGSRDEQGGRNLELQFTWDLAGGVDPRPFLEVSRERRELVELRDQVLERVNRLYFERLRLLAQAAQLPVEAAAEQAELWIREREIAAQLDAWSGGQFSVMLAAAQRAAPPPPRR